MKTYIVGENAKSFNIQGKAPYQKVVETKKMFLQNGKEFKGELVFIRTVDGFMPLIKVLGQGKSLGRLKIYYSPKAVRVVGENQPPYNGLSRAGSISEFKTRGRRPFGVEAGEIQGDLSTAPQVGEIMSGAGGKPFGVQAGEIYGDAKKPHNPFQVEGGDIENVAETDSHIYSNFKGVVAGGMTDWNMSDQKPNPTGLSAGAIDGDNNTRPESYSYTTGGHNRAYRYPNMRHYGYASPKTSPETMSYPQYFDAETFSGATGKREWMSSADGGFQGVVAGSMHDWNMNDQIPNPSSLSAGAIEGDNYTRPEPYSYMGGENEYNRSIKQFYKQPTWVVGG